MQIVFLCPPARVLNGGIRMIFRMVEALRAAGFDALVFEQEAFRPTWFPSTAPIVKQDIFRPDPDQILVFPEDQRGIWETFLKWPNKKVIYAQNPYYAATATLAGGSLVDFGISHVICVSHAVEAYYHKRHPGSSTSILPPVVDPARFSGSVPKRNAISFIPRKRRIEAAYIRDLFQATSPAFRDWEWLAIDSLPEDDAVRLMKESSVFLCLARLEGFSITGVEAMASGCVVAGFTGGDKDYTSPENGFWVEKDDPDACVEALQKAVSLVSLGKAGGYLEAGRKTASLYTDAAFQEAVPEVWKKIVEK